MVVMTAFLTPIRRPMISTTGVMQLVVQEAQEIIRSSAPGSVTPWTMQQTCVSLGRRRQHRILGPGGKMLAQAFRLGEQPGALQGDFHPQVFPGQLGRILDTQKFNGLAIHHQVVAADGHAVLIYAVDGVIIQQVDQVIQVHKIVDRHQFQLGPVHDDFESRPANPSHAVNRYLGHNHPPPQIS